MARDKDRPEADREDREDRLRQGLVLLDHVVDDLRHLADDLLKEVKDGG